MVKFLVLCLGVLCAAVSVRALTKEELSKIESAMLVHVNECNKEFGVSEADLKEAREKKDVDGIDSCLIGCIFKKAGVINDKGLFDKDNALKTGKEFLTNADDQGKFETIAEECSKVNDEKVSDGEEGCERAKLLLKCLAKHKDALMVSRR